MRVLHVPFTYFPAPCGGTEVYVAALCRELEREGIESVVAAPDTAASVHTHEGVSVHRFAIDPAPSLTVLNGGGDVMAARSFGQVLDQVAPDLVHFHARSPAVSHLTLREARQRGIPAVFTYHTPTATCNRGSLMRWGREPCDGKLRAALCAACHLNSLGMPRTAARLATALSPVTGLLAPWLPKSASWQLPTRALGLTRQRHQHTREWLKGMHRIVALNDWTLKLLALNDVPRDRIRKVRHGLTQHFTPSEGKATGAREPGQPLRLVFLGRLDPTKGLGLLLDTLAAVPDLPLQLDIYTIISEPPDAQAAALLQQIAQDPRARIRTPVPPADVIRTLQAYDLLLAPSQWFETGPLVVLESFAAGLPVAGSNLAGIAEWVRHEQDGLLLPHDSPQAWAAALRRLVQDPLLLPALRQNVRPPRLMQEVAREVAVIYGEVLAEKTESPAD